jgi:hypothetical protein
LRTNILIAVIQMQLDHYMVRIVLDHTLRYKSTEDQFHVRTFLKMPIVVHEQDWSQQDDTLEITIPLKGHSKADVYCKYQYIIFSEFTVPENKFPTLLLSVGSGTCS